MLCKYCGYQIKQGIKICPNCGRSVSVDSEGMRHDDDVVFESEADYRRSKPKRQQPRDNDDMLSEQPHKMNSGIKAVIIIAVVVLIAVAGVLFALKGGYLKSLFAKTPETSEEAAPVAVTTNSTEPDTVEDNTDSSDTTDVEFKTGYYKITKSNGAAMYTSNRIYNENASHIVANGKYVEIKAFEYNDSYTLGFACENGEFYGWIRMSDAEYAPDYKSESTTKATTTAKAPEATTAKPVETTKAPETTTAKQSTGRYKVSDSVGDNLNVRKGPGTDYDVVDSIDIGTGVTVVEWNGSWAHITIDGNDAGYVYGEYLDKE